MRLGKEVEFIHFGAFQISRLEVVKRILTSIHFNALLHSRDVGAGNCKQTRAVIFVQCHVRRADYKIKCIHFAIMNEYCFCHLIVGRSLRISHIAESMTSDVFLL